MKNYIINSSKKCSKCGSDMVIDDTHILTTYPPQYSYECSKCGNIETDWVIYNKSQYIDSDNTPGITTNKCEHRFLVQLISGQLVSVCERCGKIGDTKDYFNNTTCGLGRYYGL